MIYEVFFYYNIHIKYMQTFCISFYMSAGVHGYDTIRLRIHHTVVCLLVFSCRFSSMVLGGHLHTWRSVEVIKVDMMTHVLEAFYQTEHHSRRQGVGRSVLFLSGIKIPTPGISRL